MERGAGYRSGVLISHEGDRLEQFDRAATLSSAVGHENMPQAWHKRPLYHAPDSEEHATVSSMNNDQASPVLPETRSTRRPASNSSFLLQAVAALKLLEALVLCATGIAALELLRPDITQGVENWLSLLPLSSEQRIAQHLLNSLTGLGPHRIKALGGVVFAYAALFVVEGVGLLRKKRWAEWVTVLTTALLVPFELWELSERATLAKAGALVINLLVLWYLVHRIRASSSAHNIK